MGATMVPAGWPPEPSRRDGAAELRPP